MSIRTALTSVLALAAALPALAEPSFNRIASFPTAANMAEGEDRARPTSAEIMAVSEDGNMLVYSDSPLGVIGLVDITDPARPAPLGNIAMEGEPTTTVIRGGTAFVGVNRSTSRAAPAGVLGSVDLATRKVTASCDLGGQPDSVAISAGGDMIAVAIENERDEDVNDGALPQAPAGFVVRLPVTGGIVDCAAKQVIDLTGLAQIAPEDPEPEYLAFNAAGELAVTLQENNHIVLIGPDGTVTRHFSAGAVDLAGIDTDKDGAITPDASLTGVLREPDALAWIDTDHFVTANEGDWQGGSRGFTIWKTDGSVVFDSGNLLDRELMRIGHYPEGRSGKKGGEPEAVIAARYGDQPLIFVASERGSVVFVFDVTDPTAPVLLQALPSGIGPEGLVAIPARNLFATANETDLGGDGGARAHVMLYQRSDTPPAYPTLTAQADAPMGWGALSGLAMDTADPSRLYAVSDSAYAAAPAIYTIDAATRPARIIAKTVVTRDGTPAEKLDLEGIAADGQGGFWLASEGNAEKGVPHAVLHVDATGAVTQEFPLPATLSPHAQRFGFEGIAVVDGKLWLAVQRAWGDDPADHAKLLRLDPASGEWAGVLYPLEAAGSGWVGLSELALHGDALYLIERDNQIGEAAQLKAITRIKLADLAPAALGTPLPVVRKEILRDLIPDLKGWGGYVQDKVEGMTIAPDGTTWLVTDNDGVDDASGETLLWSVKLN